QVARMYLEEPRQQHTGGIGQVRPRSAFDLREIALADRFAEFLLNHAAELLLRKLAAEPPQRAFPLAHVPNSFPDRHIPICDLTIAMCDGWSRGEFGLF